MRTEQEIRADLDAAKVEENRQYWAFTRTARGKPVDPAVTRRIVALEDELRALDRSPEPEVSSRSMTCDGIDTAARNRFHTAQAKAARKIGKSETEAAAFADMMCEMYGHHFRIWR